MSSGERSVAYRHHLLASGRDADVYIRSDGLLVKRNRAGESLAGEAELLRYLAGREIPVPRLVEAHGPELVMEYVPGRTMAQELDAKPWRAPALGRCLAHLHRLLDAVPAPHHLPRHGAGDRLLHLDLHPGNVVLGPAGPVVLDWSTAARGDRAVDAALSWLSLALAKLRPVRRATRWTLLRAFQSELDRTVTEAVPAAAAIRLASRERDAAEREAVRRIVARCQTS